MHRDHVYDWSSESIAIKNRSKTLRAIDTRRAVWVWKLFGALLFSGVPEKEREKGERERSKKK